MKLKFYISYKRIIKQLILSILIVLIGYKCIKSDLGIITIIGYLNLIMGVVSFTISVFFLFKSVKPQLILSENGIMYKIISKKNISWNKFEDYKIYKERNNQVLELNFSRNFENHKFKYLYRKKSNKDLKEGLVKMDISVLTIDFESLKIYLNSRKPFINKV